MAKFGKSATNEKRRLQPLARQKVRPEQGRARASKELIKAWQSALDVTEHDVAAHVPTSHDILICEAILAGMTTPDRMVEYTGLSTDQVREVLGTPVVMAWVSRQIYSHISHRLGLVDSALFARALRGEIGAIKLLYERLGRLSKDISVKHEYSGSVNIKALTEADLFRLVQDKMRIIDVESTETPRNAISGPVGVGEETAGSAPAPVPAPEEASETT